MAEELKMPFVKSSTMPHTTEEADAGASQHFQQPATATCQVKENCKKKDSVGKCHKCKKFLCEKCTASTQHVCTSCKYNTCILPYKIDVCVLPLYITCLVTNRACFENEKHQTRVLLLLELISDAYLTAN